MQHIVVLFQFLIIDKPLTSGNIRLIVIGQTKYPYYMNENWSDNLNV